MSDLITQFKDAFEYKDGQIFWKKTFGTRAIKGNRAGKNRVDGYRDVGLQGKTYLEHRIIFALVYGYLPDIVDHKDRNPSNNTAENLREADYSLNAWNSGNAVNNKTGVKGVRKVGLNKFEARLAVRGKSIQVGTFNTLEEAKVAIENVRISNHNHYACHG